MAVILSTAKIRHRLVTDLVTGMEMEMGMELLSNWASGTFLLQAIEQQELSLQRHPWTMTYVAATVAADQT